MWKTQFDFHPRVVSESGSPLITTYSGSYDSKGRIVLEESGVHNLYEEIQSFAESTDIYTILSRFQNGEVDVLQRSQGFYDDISEIPDNWVDVMNVMKRSESIFSSLPAEVRADFNNSHTEFLAALSDPDFNDRISKFVPAAKAESDEEVISDEQKLE